jgi:hypothetical protein
VGQAALTAGRARQRLHSRRDAVIVPFPLTLRVPQSAMTAHEKLIARLSASLISRVAAARRPAELAPDLHALLAEMAQADDTTFFQFLDHCEQRPDVAVGLLKVLHDCDRPGDPRLESLHDAWISRCMDPTIAKVLEWFVASEDAAKQVFPPRPPTMKTRVGWNRVRAPDSTATVVISRWFFGDTIQSDVLWDRLEVGVRHPIAAAAALTCDGESVEFRIEGRPAWTPPELFRYHPERFRHSRHYSRHLRQVLRNDGPLTPESMIQVMNTVTAEMRERLNEVTRRQKAERQIEATIVIDAEEHLMMAWANFVAAGRQIFELPDPLVQMLQHTDADDVPVDLVRCPYPVLYLHFGAQPDLELEPDWFIDGVYVMHSPADKHLSFNFTAAPTRRQDVETWHAFGEPTFSLALVESEFSSDLATAADQALARTLRDLGVEQAMGDRDLTAEARLYAEQMGAPPVPQRVEQISGRRAARQIAQVTRRYPIMRQALQLAVNALCYLTAYPDDIVPSWPEGTPSALREKAEQGTPKERLRAQSKLEAQGYTQVHLAGHRLTAHPVPPSAIARDRSVRTHWRRGHWRRQAYGEGRQLRKLIWLMPTLINPSNDGVDVLGHIYRSADLPPVA